MKLRWYQTYDENGVYTENTLQYKDQSTYGWEDVPFVREREVNEDD